MIPRESLELAWNCVAGLGFNILLTEDKDLMHHHFSMHNPTPSSRLM